MAMNFLKAQATNRRRTLLLVSFLSLILVAVALAFEARFTGNLPYWESWQDFLARPPLVGAGAFAFSLGYAGLSYFAGARTILFLSKARPINRADLKELQFANVAEEMAIAAGLPVPQLWILPDDDLNAFATGRDPEHAAIAITEGLLKKLSRDELQGVVAHEMGHVKNHDILLMLFVTCMLGAILLMTEIILRTRGGGRVSRNKKGGGYVVLMVIGAVLVAWIASRIVAMAVSREREYLADATGAELTRNPVGLASALQKIRASIQPTAIAHAATAPLFIDDPKGSKLNEKESFFASLFSTHPPIEQRIRRLEGMAFADLKRERRARGLDPLTGK